MECILGQENVKGEHKAQLNVSITMNFGNCGAESTDVLVAVKTFEAELHSNSFAAACIPQHTGPSMLPKDSLEGER